MTDYQKAVDYLYSLQKFGIKFGLNQTENLLAQLGHPQRRLRCIHVAGTNGKGSTAAMLAAMLKAHGLKVGLYTSPHLVRFTERFMIDGREVGEHRILDIFDRITKFMDPAEPPTFFEVVTAMALACFAEEDLDWSIIEVGMGGRLDATNVIRPELSIITNVALEHQEYLGYTIAAIAREKAGIIKNGVPVVTGARQPAVQSVLKTTCAARKADLYRLGKHFKVRRNSDGSFQYHGLGLHLPHLELSLRGEHQHGNAALALCGLEVLQQRGALKLKQTAVTTALPRTTWPARLETLERNPMVLLDGAHNAHGAEALRIALKQDLSYDKLHLVLGIMSDKDIRGMFRRLLPLAETVILTHPAYPRAADPETLRPLARPYHTRVYVIQDPAAAIAQAKSLAEPNDLVCIAGSLYFAGEVKRLYGEAEPASN